MDPMMAQSSDQTAGPVPPPVSRPLHDPGRWLAFLRVVVGLWFAKALVTKLSLSYGFLPVASPRWAETLPRIVSGYAEVNPLPWVKAFLEQAVLGHPRLFANLTALGEAAVGIGLTAGLLTGIAAMLGLVILGAYTLAGLGLPLPRLGFRMVLWLAMIAFLFARAGRCGGVDAWIARRYPGSLAARFPWS